MANWLSNFVVVMVTPLGLKELNYKFYIIWSLFCISFIPIVYFFYPETAQKSLEEIDIEFIERPGILRDRFGLLKANKNDATENVELQKISLT